MEDHQENVSTVKRRTALHLQTTPASICSEGKIYERGLKKLASEAYRFVSMQKKTTYKEVARNLISSLQDEGEMEMSMQGIQQEKRGEMNIKRRVYDALNVLIALGLLKRNGNKITGRKLELDVSSGGQNGLAGAHRGKQSTL